jgi:hypothetical protein
MFISHRFGSVETLSRARHWLTRLGFEVASFDPESHDASRLSLKVGLAQASAAISLLDSIERSDPEGWPGFMTRPNFIHLHGAHTIPSCSDHDHAPTKTPIHWQKPDETASTHLVSSKVSEYMFSRWE